MHFWLSIMLQDSPVLVAGEEKSEIVKMLNTQPKESV